MWCWWHCWPPVSIAWQCQSCAYTPMTGWEECEGKRCKPVCPWAGWNTNCPTGTPGSVSKCNIATLSTPVPSNWFAEKEESYWVQGKEAWWWFSPSPQPGLSIATSCLRPFDGGGYTGGLKPVTNFFFTSEGGLIINGSTLIHFSRRSFVRLHSTLLTRLATRLRKQSGFCQMKNSCRCFTDCCSALKAIFDGT